MSTTRPLAAALAMMLAVACSGDRGTPSPAAPPASAPAPQKTPSSPAALAPVELTRAPCGSARARRTVSFRIATDTRYRARREEFARAVRTVLCDERSWIAGERVRFRYDPSGSLLIGLRTPGEAERRCLALIRLSVRRFYSCGTRREVVINADRWFGGSPHWAGPLLDYRRMLTNHEVGHALGLHHRDCPRDGAPAPVMMQQSKGLTSPNGRTCERNSWPLPSELARL